MAKAAESRARSEPLVYTVSELTRRIKTSLEVGYPSVVVHGELSNTKIHSSGHFYFTLKDAGAQLSGVMWRSRVGTLAFRPEDGMKVIATGRITVYEPRGAYQLDAWSIKPVGIGELQLAFERLKARLEKEGLFEQDRKKPIPHVPRKVGVVTSASGAAIRDILTVIGRRFPAVEVIFRAAIVQGVGAAEDIAAGIEEINSLPDIDVLIVGRGGGSLEDLWAFNEEPVARAIARSTIPVVSAVGHEVDYTIADYVADLRAPTPSAAAELVVPDKRAILAQVANSWYTIHQGMEALLEEPKERIAHLLTSYAFTRPADLLRQFAQRIDDLHQTISLVVSHHRSLVESRFHAADQRLAALDPKLPLQRGFALVRREGKHIGQAALLHSGDRVEMEFRDGSVRSTIDDA
ncbi:MAG: exodeoxyribonuclease VII large subunit [Bacteroidota bacterium]